MSEAVTPLLDTQGPREGPWPSSPRTSRSSTSPPRTSCYRRGSSTAARPRPWSRRFEDWIKEHHDEYVALEAYFEQPYERRPTLDDIKDLAKAIEAPPLNFKRQRLWEAYRTLDQGKVRGDGGKTLADIVSLIRFAVHQDDELTPARRAGQAALRHLD